MKKKLIILTIILFLFALIFLFFPIYKYDTRDHWDPNGKLKSVMKTFCLTFCIYCHDVKNNKCYTKTNLNNPETLKHLDNELNLSLEFYNFDYFTMKKEGFVDKFGSLINIYYYKNTNEIKVWSNGDNKINENGKGDDILITEKIN